MIALFLDQHHEVTIVERLTRKEVQGIEKYLELNNADHMMTAMDAHTAVRIGKALYRAGRAEENAR